MTSLGASAPPFPGVASASTREGQTRLIGSGARRPSGPWGSSRALVEEHGQRAVEIAAWKGDHWSPSPLALAGHSIRQHTSSPALVRLAARDRPRARSTTLAQLIGHREQGSRSASMRATGATRLAVVSDVLARAGSAEIGS